MNTRQDPFFLDFDTSPVHQLHSQELDRAGIELYVKREDLVDPELGGNKWRKLKYNIAAAHQQKHNTLLTFGGAWSNHIYATAAAGKRLGLHTIGLIRGEAQATLNPTLKFARDCGMQIDYLDRATYRDKTNPDFINSLKNRYGRFYLLPEGGSNALAVRGCAEIVEELNGQLDNKKFDALCVACGTGATLAGLASKMSRQQHAIGFSVLKGGEFLTDNVKDLLEQTGQEMCGNWEIKTGYHFGGYARTNAELWEFMEKFNDEFNIQLDAVYTGKMFYGLFELIKNRHFSPGSRVVAIHTGGLQGNLGFKR